MSKTTQKQKYETFTTWLLWFKKAAKLEDVKTKD